MKHITTKVAILGIMDGKSPKSIPMVSGVTRINVTVT